MLSVCVRAGKQRVPYVSGWYRPEGVTVVDVGTQKVMARVDSTHPAAGTYRVTRDGVFTFSAGDAGREIGFVTYPFARLRR